METVFGGRSKEAERLLGREYIGVLRRRARLLDADESLLTDLVLNQGNSFGQIAYLMGLSEGTVRRRFGKILGRLSSGEVSLLFEGRLLTHSQDYVARAYYLKGMSQEAIARESGKTPYFIRKTLRAIRALARKKTGRCHGNRDASSPRAAIEGARVKEGRHVPV
ncbi:MAG: hypothetical protein LLF76_04935 [Planctomycetaceae bacterium]|nr:hypothetical protein [Planctomycetaceae bacterium]